MTLTAQCGLKYIRRSSKGTSVPLGMVFGFRWDSEQQNPRAKLPAAAASPALSWASPLPVPYREVGAGEVMRWGKEGDIQKALATKTRKEAREHERPEYT